MSVFRIFFRSLALIVIPVLPATAQIDFSLQVRPILSDKCFACHGFDQHARQAELRLDIEEGLLGDKETQGVVIPGEPEASELIARVTTDDDSEVMPPTDSHKDPLTPEEVGILRQWIAEGAGFSKHWSFVPPTREDSLDRSDAIDTLVSARLKTELPGHQLAPAATPATLARRLSFDLTGLPPDFVDVQNLQTDPSEENYLRYIDQLLKSPHYGERMAMWWLDGARYSDTDGFQGDATRTNWPWRDWVIDAFNSNMPFDQFTVQQFAGDLLPGATTQQQLATCFHRNHMNNGEGGRDPEESRVDYVLDRVNTIGTLWLGLTLGCTQCHDHKFDPIAQSDYYSLTAYFNSIDESGSAGGGAGPFMKVRSPYAKRAAEEARAYLTQSEKNLAVLKDAAINAARQKLEQQIRKAPAEFKPWHPLNLLGLQSVEGTELTHDGDGIITASAGDATQDDYVITFRPEALSRVTAIRLEVFSDPRHAGGRYSFAESGEFILTNIKVRTRRPGASLLREIKVAGAIADIEGVGEDKKYGRVRGTLDDDPRTGWTTRTKETASQHTAVFELSEPIELEDDESIEIVLMQRSLALRELIGRFRLSATDQRGSAVRSLKPMPWERLAEHLATAEDSDQIPQDIENAIIQQYLEDDDSWQRARRRHDRAKSQNASASRSTGDIKVMVLKQREKERTTHILERGVWNQHGEQVHPAVLPILDSIAGSGDGKTRLDLAKWIVDSNNPLTPRVIVNQIWQLFFGAGLVRTPGDFGAQGELPTHPELLDWLAVELVQSQWDIKHIIRIIVSSDTYRQRSAVSDALKRLDPVNRWLARGARFRQPSWMIRDAALKASGLLNPAIGGPPVMPYQPPGVWNDQFMGRFTYTPSVGPAQNRRTIYAFWRRSSAPTFLFDSAMRRTCEVTPRRTNTPLHALTLLNNRTALECSRNLADQTLETIDDDNSSAAIAFLYERILSRSPSSRESEIAQKVYSQSIEHYRQNPEQCQILLSAGQLQAPDPATARHAATMILANLLMNLDEAITHE